MAVNEGIPVGATPEVTATFRVTDANGNLVLEDPGTVTATVEAPDGTESNPATVKQSKGIYTTSFTADAAGLWHYRIVGDAPAAGVTEGDILVADSQVLDSDPAADYTYDLTTNIGKVRLYIDDRDFTSISTSTPRGERSAIFDDDEIAQFLTAEGDSAYDAAALALLTIATNKNLMVQRRELDGANVDFGTLRKDLLDMAERFRALNDDADGGTGKPASGVAEVNYGEFTEEEIIINSWLRQGY
jgi:hypothetical protein